jgi:hypothetical protein
MNGLLSIIILFLAAISCLWVAWFFAAMVWRGISTGRLEFKAGRTNPQSYSLDRQAQPGPFWTKVTIFSAFAILGIICAVYTWLGILYQWHRLPVS